MHFLEIYLSSLNIQNLEILIGIIIASITAAFGFIKFSQTRKAEFKKEFWKKRYENYENVIQLASKICVLEDLNLVQEEIQEFRQYYWGKLAIVEDKDVMKVMIAFNNELLYIESGQQIYFTELKDRCYDLARACRRSLQNTWEPVKLDNLEEE